MFKLKHIINVKIAISALIMFFLVNCAKDQNTFLPYVRVYVPIPLANYNHLKIPGNSVLFLNAGVKGVIVVCVNPELNLYDAYDACCPYEKDYSGVVELVPVPGFQSPPGTIYSSTYTGVCNKCKSEFSLMQNAQPIKGPAVRYLQRYNVITQFEYLTVTN